MEFRYNESQPLVHEGWLQKSRKKFTGEHWQRRYFRLQGRCLFYFKKESKCEPPAGYIPLINISLENLPSSKRVPWGFVVSLHIKSEQFKAKRNEYSMQAESEEVRKTWLNTIHAHSATALVGEPFEKACTVTPDDRDCRRLLPYFVTPLLAKLESQIEVQKRMLWSTEVPMNLLAQGMAIINQNLPLPIDDTHNAIACLMAYLKALPRSLLPGATQARLSDRPTSQQLRAVILESPAPVRAFIRALFTHFRAVLDAQAVNKFNQSTLRFMAPILIRPDDKPSTFFTPGNEAVLALLLSNTSEVLDDIHQFADAVRQPVLFRARLEENQSGAEGGDLLVAEKGLLVNVVRVDVGEWCTVFTSNGRVGLAHKRNLSEQGASFDPELDAIMDVVREKLPEAVLLFDGMFEEAVKLTQLSKRPE
jgi:hypothetical protein